MYAGSVRKSARSRVGSEGTSGRLVGGARRRRCVIGAMNLGLPCRSDLLALLCCVDWLDGGDEHGGEKDAVLSAAVVLSYDWCSLREREVGEGALRYR
jgi:hypothetical protein